MDNDVEILSVVQTKSGECRGSMLFDYEITYRIKWCTFKVPMQHSNKEWWVFTAWMDDAMETYYNKTLKEMGNKRQSNREALSNKVLSLAKKKLEYMSNVPRQEL